MNQEEPNNNSQMNLEKNEKKSNLKKSQNINKKNENINMVNENNNKNKNNNNNKNNNKNNNNNNNKNNNNNNNNNNKNNNNNNNNNNNKNRNNNKDIKAIGKLDKIENKKEIKVNENEKQNDNKNEERKEIVKEEEQKKKDNDLKEKEKLRLLQLEKARLEEEKKKKEEEEKEKKEKEEREKKEQEEKDRYEFEKAEKERLEMTKKGFKEKYQTYLYLLLKNLEGINGNIETLREEINEIFNSYLPNDFEKAKETITDKVLNRFKTYLGLDENNNSEINIIKNILMISFEERNIDQFKKYLNIILNSIKNYYNLKNENSIINYIIDYLSVKTELKEEVEKNYKEVKIIKYDDFCNITKEYKVAMPDTQMEYLIFKMKSTKLDDIPLMFDDLNVMAFLWFFDENNKKEDNSIKIGVRIREY